VGCSPRVGLFGDGGEKKDGVEGAEPTTDGSSSSTNGDSTPPSDVTPSVPVVNPATWTVRII